MEVFGWGLNGSPPADLYTTEARHSTQSPLLQVDIAHDELGRTERHRIRSFVERHAVRALNRPANVPSQGHSVVRSREAGPHPPETSVRCRRWMRASVAYEWNR